MRKFYTNRISRHPGGDQTRSLSFKVWSRYFIAGATFEILDDYILEESVGQGSYGTVASAVGRETGEAVAVKKVPLDHAVILVLTLIVENAIGIFSTTMPHRIAAIFKFTI